jgi:Sulfite exporter TauE/SafE
MAAHAIAFLALAGIVGGIVNAIAGGATLITFPAMLYAGLPPIIANASNAVAILPGHLFAAIEMAWGSGTQHRFDLRRLFRRRFRRHPDGRITHHRDNRHSRHQGAEKTCSPAGAASQLQPFSLSRERFVGQRRSSCWWALCSEATLAAFLSVYCRANGSAAR